MKNNYIFGKFLKRKRIEIGMYQKDFGKCLGYGKIVYSQIEGGTRFIGVDSIENLIKNLRTNLKIKVTANLRREFYEMALNDYLKRKTNKKLRVSVL